MDPGEPGVHGGIGGDGSVDVGEREEPADAMHHRDHGGVLQPGFPEVAGVQLDVGALDPHQRVQGVCLARGEPASQLERVEVVRAAGVARQVGHRSQLGRRHHDRLERQEGRCSRHGRFLVRRRPGTQPRPPLTRRGHPKSSTLRPASVHASARGVVTQVRGCQAGSSRAERAHSILTRRVTTEGSSRGA